MLSLRFSIDLVPRSNAQAWLRYLRHATPTLPFRCATSMQRTHLSSNTAPSLLRLLKAYKPSAQSITVGIVGYPNVGKSSLINSLKRSKVFINPHVSIAYPYMTRWIGMRRCSTARPHKGSPIDPARAWNPDSGFPWCGIR